MTHQRDIMTVRLGDEAISHPDGDHVRLHVEPEGGTPFHLAVDLRVPESDARLYPGYRVEVLDDDPEPG